MTNTQKHAKQELDVLIATTPNAIIKPFVKEILDLCEAFGNSGQSGGSAPFTASVISKTINKLLLQEPICDITGNENEWNEITGMDDDDILYQNKRCSGLFKDRIKKRAYYIDAIVWKETEDLMMTGNVYINDDDFELIGSDQYVIFPFKPKTFYVDVINVPITKKDAENKNLHYYEDINNKCYYTILKDPKQLEIVFKYYNKKNKNHECI